VQTENEKAVRDFDDWADKYGLPNEGDLKLVRADCYAAWQAALQSQVSNTDGWAVREAIYRNHLHALVDLIEMTTCTHENTHRGGAIWEICDDCGAKWADDMGGKPAVFVWSRCVEDARKLLSAAPKAPQQVSNTPQDDLIALHGDGVLDSVSEEFRLQCVQQEQSGEAEQESLQAENARLKDELEELSDLLFNIRTLPVHGYLTKDEFIEAFRQEINTVPEVRVSKQRQEIEDLRRDLQAATASQESAPGQEAVAPIGYIDRLQLERWDRLRGTEFEVQERAYIGFSTKPFTSEMTDCTLAVYLAPPTSTAIAAMVIKQAAEILAGMRWRAIKLDHIDVLSKAEQAILKITPANAKAELEARMMKVAKLVYAEFVKYGKTADLDIMNAIVRRVLDEKGE
jgi:hypothetical protein